MAAAVAYNPVAYNKLPELSDAGERFRAKNGEALVEEFRRVFQEHNAERTFGLVLNHRHFEMSDAERLVEYKGTSTPWNSMHNKTRANTWLVSEEGCLPYEFHYSAEDNESEASDVEEPSNPQYRSFVQSFQQLLREKDAEGLFGLCRYPGDDFEGRVEITQGRANINLHPDDAPKHLASTAAAWFFSPNLLGKCVCICGGNGHTTASHKGHVSSR